MSSQRKALINHISQLLEGKIIELAQSTEDPNSDEWDFGFVVEFPDGSRKLAWILSDEEGNHPGFLEIRDLSDEEINNHAE